MDALGIERAVLAGFDWGARSADVVAALWPERVVGLVAVSGYLIGSVEANRSPLPPAAEPRLVVSVLLRDRARQARLRPTRPRIQSAHLANGLTGLGIRQLDVRT